MEVKNNRTFTVGAVVSGKRLVKLDTGKVVHNTATATDDPIGVSQYGVADTENVAVRLINDGGSFEVTAAGAFALDAEVFAAADGKVQALPVDAGTYRKIGKALEAATADGEIVEILPYDYQATVTVS